MDEKELEKIDELIFTDVEQRFGRWFKMMLVGKRRIKDFFMILVRAFVRCLYYSKGEMFLRDISAVTRAEANYIMDQPLYAIGSTAQVQLSEQIENLIDSEIHRWILLLAENNKLPPGSEYHRFMGKFINN